ncbi:MAG: tetratricopeptide repeat protein [candidate division Zixibacteria bacterium]|nr:tetratricopeptide repeat protein [candidate division Zixibacteria bacterium]
MDKNKATAGSQYSLIITVLFGVIILITFLIPAFGARLFANDWGMMQAPILPPGLYIIWLVLAAIALGQLLIKRGHCPVTEAVSRLLWEKPYRVYRWIALIVLLAVFAGFRFDAHLYGDGYIRIANFAQKSKTLFHWYDFGGTVFPYLFYIIWKTLGMSKVTAAALGYQTVSILSGGLFIWAVYKIASVLHDTPRQRTRFFLMTLFSGIILFFFGMVENTILLPSLIALIVLLSTKLLNNGPSVKSYLFLLVLSIIGVITHVLFLAIIPAVVFAAVVAANRRAGSLKTFGLALSGLVLIAGLMSVYITAAGDIFLENKLLFLSGKQPLPGYSLFSLPHATDILNLLVTVIPLFLIFLFVLVTPHKSDDRRGVSTFFAVLAIGQLVLLFILDPKNGMIRDFPLFAGLLPGMVFWSACRFSSDNATGTDFSNWRDRLAIPALILIIPTLVVHLSPSLTIKRLDAYLEHNEFKYEAALLAMRDYYLTKEEYDLADQRERSVRGKVPDYLKSQMINDLYVHDRYHEALGVAERLIERHPYNAQYRMQYGNVLLHFDRYRDAERELLIASQLAPDNPEIYHFLSELYRQLRHGDKCLASIQRGLNLDPNNLLLLVDLTGYYYLKHEYVAADSMIDIIMEINPEEPYAFMYRGLLAERTGHRQQALAAYRKFIELDELLPEVPQIQERIERLEPGTPPPPDGD